MLEVPCYKSPLHSVQEMDQMLFDNLFENANQMQISEIAPYAQQERKSTFLSGSVGNARAQAQAPLLWQHIQETEG